MTTQTDVVWLTLMQGVAHHVNMNAEKLRKLIVRGDDKLTIKVHRDDWWFRPSSRERRSP